MIKLVITVIGHTAWYCNDYPHRANGPAIIYPDGAQFWFYNGHRHRNSGPAVTLSNYYVEYWVKGQELSEYEHMFITGNNND